MLDILILVAVFSGGYAAAVFTWQPVHTWIVGAEAKAQQLRDKAKQLIAKARAL